LQTFKLAKWNEKKGSVGSQDSQYATEALINALFPQIDEKVWQQFFIAKLRVS
jgi:hypothetical protein